MGEMMKAYQEINKRRQSDEMDVNSLTMFAEAWYFQQAKIDSLQKQAVTQGQNFNDLAQKLKDAEYFNQKLQGRIDELLKALEYVQKSCHKSLSYEHDLFDKGWNHSSRQVIINIYRLTGVGENLINE